VPFHPAKYVRSKPEQLGNQLLGDSIVIKSKKISKDVCQIASMYLITELRAILQPADGGLQMDMRTTTRQVDMVTILDVSGKIVLGEESAALRARILDLVKQGHKQILLNLNEVTHIDSLGLGILVSSFASVKKQDGQLKLLNLTSKVQDLLQVTRLYTVFEIMDDEAAAIRSFQQTATATA
jgi:anti-sigma B factor antagonist